MALSPKSIPSVLDMEDFATDYLGLQGTDVDLFYESYYNVDNDGYEEEVRKDELNQTQWEYWITHKYEGGWQTLFFYVHC